jgi:hypothetical protein
VKDRVIKKRIQRSIDYYDRCSKRCLDSHDVFIRTAEWRDRQWLNAPLTDGERTMVAGVEDLDEEWT